MNWRKLGRIYAPERLASWAVSHASVPIALRIDTWRYRVFFSTRDEHHRSHLAFFEIDVRHPGQHLRVSPSPLLSPGGLGTFDEDGVIATSIARDGARLLLYYVGWNVAKSVPFRNAIGIAESHDGGSSFSRTSAGPALDRGIHDPVFTASPFVLHETDGWRMWYASGLGWEGADARYHIKYAHSSDGVVWSRDGLVCIDFSQPDETALARPSVVNDDGHYRMWYSRRGQAYRIGYAESENGVSWERRDGEAGIDVSAEGWDSEMICYPDVFECEAMRYMLYNGNRYGETGIGLAVLEGD